MHTRRRSLSLTVSILFALMFSSTWIGGRALPTAQAQTLPKVVYVYNNDTVSRDSFKTLLELRGFAVTTVTTSTVTANLVNWTGVQAVLIGDDTSNPADPYDWGGRTLPVPDNLYIIGIGLGGASFFEEDQDPPPDAVGVPVIGYGNTWFSSGKRAYAVNPGANAWNSPMPISLPPSGLVDLYTKPVSFTAALYPNTVPTTGVIPIGRQENDQNHYPLIAQTFIGQFNWCGLLWGFRRPPSLMTPTGRDVFVNLVKNNPCAPNNVAPVDVAITKAAPTTGIVGQPLTYTLTVKNNGQTIAPAVKVVDTLPAGVVFVSATSTQGTCSYGAGVVTCQVGNMAGGATVTITIVVKPTEAGALANSASVSAKALDTNPGNNSSGAQTQVNNPPLFTAITALPYKQIFTGPIQVFPTSDLSIFGIEVTEGIQCFDTSKGLASCPNNSLSLVAQKDSAARIYLKYSGPASSLDNVPVRLVLEDANAVQYTVNTSGRALPAINQGSASDSVNVYFNVNFSNNTFVKFYALVDPNNTIAETNESNNRYPASGFLTLNFSKRKSMTIVGQRLRYHPSGYSGAQYAGGWSVNGGAADWYEQLLPIKNGGIDYVVKSGYKDWTASLTPCSSSSGSDNQHALIQSLNTQWILENVFPWLFGTSFTGARHVYGWVPNAGYPCGHADMPVYPHAGGLGVVAIGTDAPGTSTDNPGAGALIFGHELTHDYNLKHTDTGADDCGSDDSSSDFPYGTSGIQEYGFNPYTGKVYDPANTHDLMSYCPSGGSKLGWISPFTWQRMFDDLSASLAIQAGTAQAPDSVLAVDVAATNPALGPETGAFGDLYKVDAQAPIVPPAPGDYAIQLRGSGGAVLATVPFSLTFESEYSGPGSDAPGDPSPRPSASAAMNIPWVEGTTDVVLLHGAQQLASKHVSAGAPLVQITSPSAAITWTAGTTQTLTWDAADPDGDTLRYSVFYSHDGATWALLATGLTAKSYAVNVDALAGGTDARFRVVATDGVNTGDDETDFSISVPDKPPAALILSPADQAQVLPGDLVVLQGAGNDFEDGTLPGVSLVWSSDRQGALGTGTSLPINNLQQGAHTITLTVTDSKGQTAQATVNIYIGAKLYVPLVVR